MNESTSLELPPVPSGAVSQLAHLTDVGHRALLRYRRHQRQRDLDEAITSFQLVHDMCSSDNPNRTAILFNLATAKFIRCQDNNHYRDLDVTISLYQDALHLRPNNPDHRMTALSFCFALLVRLQSSGNQAERESKVFVSKVTESYGYRTAWFALQMAGISLSQKMMKYRTPHATHMDPDDDELIRRARAMLLGLSDDDSRRLGLLGGLGDLLHRRLVDDNHHLPDIHETILVLEQVVRLIPDGDKDKPAFLDYLADSLFLRFQRLGDLADIERCISMGEEGVRLSPNSDPNKGSFLNNLGSSLMSRFKRFGDLADIQRAISVFEKGVQLTPDGDPHKPDFLKNLGNSLFARFQRLGDLADLDKTILADEKTVLFTPHGHPNKAARLSHLGDTLTRRFEHRGDLADLQKAISMLEEALYLTPVGHPDKPARLDNLGSSLRLRFQRLGGTADIDKSISIKEDAMRLTPNDNPNKPVFLSSLGSSLSLRFERFGNIADLDKSILMEKEAVFLTPADHPDKPTRLNDLASSLSRRLRHLGNLTDMDESISMFEEAVGLTHNGDPNKPTWLNNLGNSLLNRFEQFGNLADINKSVSVAEEAVALVPDEQPNKTALLATLGNSLCSRFMRLGDLRDLDRSILMGKEAVNLTPHDHPDRPTFLGGLGIFLSNRFTRLGDLTDIDNSISMFEEAVGLIPDGHTAKPSLYSNLANSLVHRFQSVGDLADLNKSISVGIEAVRLTNDSHLDKPIRLNTLGNSFLKRFETLGDLADIDKSVQMGEQAVALFPDGHPNKPVQLNDLGFTLCHRFQRVGDLSDIDKSISIMEEAVHLTPNTHPLKPRVLSNLALSFSCRFTRLRNPADIDKSISKLEEAMSFTPNGHPTMPTLLGDLGAFFYYRFGSLGDIADVHKSISKVAEAVRLTPDGHPNKPGRLANLGNAWLVCFEHSSDPSDLRAAISHFSAASRSTAGHISTRFLAARRWISSARLEGDSQVILDAYTGTIMLLPQLAWLGLPLAERHRVLLQAADVARDAAAAALDSGCPEMAVEWLEQGRSIIWSQFLQLRNPVDELHVEHPALARQFQQISEELEHASSRDHAASHPSEDHLASFMTTQSPEQQVQRHHDLALKREKLLAEIRSLTGFDRFLLPKTFKQLKAYVNSGLVIYLNASEHRCDALIVCEMSSAISVPLANITYEDVELLQNVLRLSLKHNGLIISRRDISAFISEEDPVSQRFLDSLLSGYHNVDTIGRAVKAKQQRIAGFTSDDFIRLILAYLWNNAVNPVLRALGFSHPPSDTEKMPRILWCPTGPFAFLPIHAAGLYQAGETGTKLSDFAISSYVPSLSALTSPTQKDLNVPSSNVRLLAVPQPSTDGLSRLVFVKDEIDHIRNLSSGSPFVTLQESHGTVEDVMEKLKHTDWVHFACHGIQDPKNPLDSGLCLANSHRLKLSDIIRLSRPHGGLAFLSACQTAQGDEKLSEESVHLAAGMLLAGYDSVIATLWAIGDRDAPKVTKDVYDHLFRDGKVPDSAEAAEALHHAVQHLRDSGASFTSWVPFIHVGR